MSMGISRASCATVMLPLLFTSLVHAEPPQASPPPAVDAASVGAVPIEIHGAQPGLRLEVQDPRTKRPLALCTGDCQATIVPGRYRFFVNATADTRAGSRDIMISEPSRLLITPPSEARRTTGLALGIAGPVLMVLGSVVFLNNLRYDVYGDSNDNSGSDDGAVAGIAMIIGGIVITPIGWIMFGTSTRPKVEVTPLPR